MTITDIKKENCCGCGVCVAVCNVKAIRMKEDECGFLYPVIDMDKCLKCEICYKVCVYGNNQKSSNSFIRAYAAKSNDIDIQRRASSGGVSFELAKKIIKNGGIVYGVSYDDNYVVHHRRIDSFEECNRLFGSKYVQSDSRNIMQELYQDLKNNKKVLYFGTSCYVGKLISFLNYKKCKIDNLITVDLICHGVPSPGLFKEYISLLKKNKKFEHFDFRTKKLPWGYGSKNYGCTIYYQNGKEEVDSAKARLFLNLFFSNNCIREHCYHCEYCNINKPSDITVADYWGLQDQHPDIFDENGVNAVITHSEKGDNLLRSSNINMVESTIEKISKKQANMSQPSQKSSHYDEFWEDYRKKGFQKIAKKYGGYNLRGIIGHSILVKLIRKII